MKYIYIYILFSFILLIFLILLPNAINENSKFNIYKKDVNKIYYKNKVKLPSPPNNEHILGLDKSGRDVLSRLIIATRNSILLAFSYAFLSAILGIFIGIFIGNLRFKTCMLVSKLVEALQTLPFTYIIMLVFYFFLRQEKYNILEIIIIFTLVKGWIKFSFIARNATLIIKNFDYIKASKTMGASNLNIIIKHIFPEVLTSISAIIPLHISRSLTKFEVVAFLQKEDKKFYPSLGELLSYMQMGKNYLYIWIWPLIILVIINIFLAFLNLKLRKKIKYLICS